MKLTTKIEFNSEQLKILYGAVLFLKQRNKDPIPNIYIDELIRKIKPYLIEHEKVLNHNSRNT